jgi:coenzyme F420-reducing hydrogenase alpha subunit
MASNKNREMLRAMAALTRFIADSNTQKEYKNTGYDALYEGFVQKYPDIPCHRHYVNEVVSTLGLQEVYKHPKGLHVGTKSQNNYEENQLVIINRLRELQNTLGHIKTILNDLSETIITFGIELDKRLPEKEKTEVSKAPVKASIRL